MSENPHRSMCTRTSSGIGRGLCCLAIESPTQPTSMTATAQILAVARGQRRLRLRSDQSGLRSVNDSSTERLNATILCDHWARGPTPPTWRQDLNAPNLKSKMRLLAFPRPAPPHCTPASRTKSITKLSTVNSGTPRMPARDSRNPGALTCWDRCERIFSHPR